MICIQIQVVKSKYDNHGLSDSNGCGRNGDDLAHRMNTSNSWICWRELLHDRSYKYIQIEC